MTSSATILEWLKEAGAYAFQCEDPDRPGGRILVDVVVSGGTVGVRGRTGESEQRSRSVSEQSFRLHSEQSKGAP